MSRRARNRSDKRAIAFNLHRSDDAPMPLIDGSTHDPRMPWYLPVPDDSDESQNQPHDHRIQIGPLDVSAPSQL